MSGRVKVESLTFVMLVAGVGFFLLSLVGMGLAPWTSLKHVTSVAGSPANPYVDENGKITPIGRGRKIYIAEGCWHCHSQFVRPVAGEPYRYGPPSQAMESMFDVPQLFGTRRVGPDLSREAGRRSDDWHLAHLYNPRITTPLSVMPSYPQYFKRTPEGPKPLRAANDLVAYLQYLGRNYKDEIEAIVHPRLFKVSGAPDVSEVNLVRGESLYTENCIGCHGNVANGEGRAKTFLRPAAANLVTRYVAPSEVYSILNRGVLGSAMPSFREMPERDLWAISQFVAQRGEGTRTSTLAANRADLIEQGRKVFSTFCFACHGTGGGGDGPGAANLNPRPKDFTRRVFSPDVVRRTVTNGVPGSAMTPFPLTDAEIDAVAAFITSLYNERL